MMALFTCFVVDCQHSALGNMGAELTMTGSVGDVLDWFYHTLLSPKALEKGMARGLLSGCFVGSTLYSRQHVAT